MKYTLRCDITKAACFVHAQMGDRCGNRCNMNGVIAGEKETDHRCACSHVGKLQFVIHCCYFCLRMHHVECAHCVHVTSLNVVPAVLSHVYRRTHDSGPRECSNDDNEPLADVTFFIHIFVHSNISLTYGFDTPWVIVATCSCLF